MPATPEFSQSFRQIEGQLACPACYGALSLGNAGLLCSGCGRLYPVVDGIPVLIAKDPGTGPEANR